MHIAVGGLGCRIYLWPQSRFYVDRCPHSAHQGCCRSKRWLDAELEWPPEQLGRGLSSGRPVSPLFQSYPAFRLNWLFVVSDRLLFATTNHIERLDPALSRPGRMDKWISFTNATKWQAEGIFKYFFPSRPSASSSSPPSPADASEKSPTDSRRKPSARAMPILEEAEIAQLAKRFADAIPEGEMSVHNNFPPVVAQYLVSYVCLAGR